VSEIKPNSDSDSHRCQTVVSSTLPRSQGCSEASNGRVTCRRYEAAEQRVKHCSVSEWGPVFSEPERSRYCCSVHSLKLWWPKGNPNPLKTAKPL